MSLPELIDKDWKDIPDGAHKPFGVFQGSKLLGYKSDIQEARELMRENLGSHIQYYYATPDVLRYESLFDTRLTKVVTKILENNTGLADIVLNKAYHIRIDEGELSLQAVYEILEESEESWVGINLNRVCLNTVRSWIVERINGNS